MNRKQIIQMAQEARLAFDSEEYPDIWQTYMYVGREEIEAFAKLVEQSVLIEWANEFAGLGEWVCVNRIENELKEKNT